MADNGVFATTFTPSGAFGLNIDGEMSQDTLNTTDIGAGRSGHAIRFFPLLDANKRVIANTWIVAMDYQNGKYGQNVNSDYQDNVFIVSNIAPAATPATPADFQAALGATGVNLQWAPVNGVVGYNVLRSINGGSFTQINSSNVPGTSFVDLAPPAGTLINYEVVAVNSSHVASPPASASLRRSVGPAGQIGPPAAPASVAGNGSNGTQVILSWTASAGATSYIVQREGPGETSFTTSDAARSRLRAIPTAPSPPATFTHIK